MKKNFYLIVLLIIPLISCTSNNRQPAPMYKYSGTYENDSDMRSLRMDQIFKEDYTKEQRKQLEQGEFENGIEESAVPDPETAFYIAKKIMINKFGEEDVRKDYPFVIWLVDNYEWRIIGSSKGRSRFGDSSITCSICRLDGRILGCYHEKQQGRRADYPVNHGDTVPLILNKYGGEFGPAGRTFINAKNIKVDDPQGLIKSIKTPISTYHYLNFDFHNSHNRVDTWIDKTKQK